MHRHRWYHISLAAKCLILFGVSVLLILGGTLYLPWVRMEGLSATADVRLAEQAAIAARLSSGVDFVPWTRARERLRKDWPTIERSLDTAVARVELIPTSELIKQSAFAPRGFFVESFRALQSNVGRQYVHKFKIRDGQRLLRLAMAIRASETDPQPNHLRGVAYVEMQAESQPRQWSVIVLALAGLSGGFLAVLVFYIVTQRLFLSPVRDLTAVAEQITEGDTDVRAVITTGDEFEELSDAFNDMLVRISKSHEELRTINRSLDVKLEELAEINVALFESNKLKSEFIANVSHELRTPMGLIINFAELLRDALENPPESMTRPLRYAGHIVQAGRALLEIINDLLDLAKIEAGKVDLHITDFNVLETCRSLMDFVKPLGDKKNLDVQLDVISEPAPMHSDSGRVKQILYNLLSNAIKFTPDEGSVRMEISAQPDDRICVRVIDTGPGIPEDMHEAVFEKFRQIDSSLTREHSGAGLGLAITKELTKMLGGTIRVDSAPDHGSTFTVILPLNAPDQAQRGLISLN